MRERFEKFITPEPNTGCWLWIGAIHRDEDGAFGSANRALKAHRVAYGLYVGPIPRGFAIDHLCRNRSCVNPAHLEPVTLAENNRRKPRVTHCPRGHEFIPENTREWRGLRFCIACNRLHKKRKSTQTQHNGGTQDGPA